MLLFLALRLTTARLDSHTILINFTHAAIIATINSDIQLHVRRLKGSGILFRSHVTTIMRHMIHGRVCQVGGNELTS